MLEAIYEQSSPGGYLGRGTHYSVMRSLLWHDEDGNALPRPQYNDFAVIWDEDHDGRVLAFIEKMQMHGLIAPVLFIGERKGSLTVIVESKVYFDGDIDSYRQSLEKLMNECDSEEDMGDWWPIDIGTIHESFGSAGDCLDIINASKSDVLLYLFSIKMQWRLGMKTTDEVKSLIERLG